MMKIAEKIVKKKSQNDFWTLCFLLFFVCILYSIVRPQQPV